MEHGFELQFQGAIADILQHVYVGGSSQFDKRSVVVCANLVAVLDSEMDRFDREPIW
jgi:hypothetical protein